MKRTNKSMMGVTLLEIMLVLAIAALVIVMSIRFYQSASSSQKINAMAGIIQGITAASENYYNSHNASYDSLTKTSVQPYMPNGVMPKTPWGGAIDVTGAGSKLTITPSSVPATACVALSDFLKTDSRYAVDTTTCVTTYTQ